MSEAHPPAACNACSSTHFERRTIVSNDKAMHVDGEHTVFVCAECGSGTTTPFVADEDLGSLYADDYASFQDVSFPRGLGWLLRIARKAADGIVHRNTPASSLRGRTGTLLEVGCGGGRVGGSYVERGWTVVGIEPSPGAAEMAGKRGLKVSVGTLGTFEAGGRTFDAVLFRHSLEHVVDPRADLSKVAALLDDGGTLMIEVPNFGCWQVRVFRDRWFALGVPTHRTHFTDKGLRAAVESSGLTVTKSNTGSSPVTLLASIQYRLFDRWVPQGRVSNILTSIAMIGLFPVTWTINKLMGGGDVLRMVAVKA